MRKLKLESLEVESFETVARMPAARGTVQGHAPQTVGCPDTGTVVNPGTAVSDCLACTPSQWNCPASVWICLDTEYLDCTYGCTRNTCDPRVNSCGDVCWIENTAGGCTIHA